ncbi:MAG: threonine synthase [Saprospiraceae bacterium]|nr:threonine synthase [Saprospiraceae bacterium]
MKLYSTNNKEHFTNLKDAVLKGLPEDNGLYMPSHIPVLPKDFIDNIESFSIQEIAFTICKALFNSTIPENDLKEIVYDAINFPAPIVSLKENIHVLELFHGPSLAFKDFGARFMARLMSYFDRANEEELVILVATSGDTGGAVAYGFLQTLGIKVVILYPSGKVSPLQEKQLTTLGHNIYALEVNGTFDDCQAMVKKAFLDQDLRNQIRISSANSINIARLIPQSFYYFEAYKQLKNKNNLVFCVPSGNFGNLTAGLFAKKMGLPIQRFIAATNINDVVPTYLKTGTFKPRPSVRTISNAMDVGNPSNFARMLDLYCSTGNIKEEIKGYAYTDDVTKKAIKEVYEKYNYIIDPHGAVGYLALKKYLDQNPSHNGVVLETAHYSKFKETVDTELEFTTEVPERLAILEKRKKEAKQITAEYNLLKSYLLEKR